MRGECASQVPEAREPGEPVQLVALAGPPASGKSVTGRALARAMGAALLDLDTVTNPLFEILAAERGATDFGDPALESLREPRYECLFGIADDCVSAGVPVVLVAPLSAECRDRARWSSLAGRFSRAGAAPSLVWLSVPRDVLAVRLRGRAAQRDREKLSHKGYLDSTIQVPESPSFVVDATLSTVQQVAAILHHLAR